MIQIRKRRGKRTGQPPSPEEQPEPKQQCVERKRGLRSLNQGQNTAPDVPKQTKIHCKVSRAFPSWDRSTLTEIHLCVTPGLIAKLPAQKPRQGSRASPAPLRQVWRLMMPE
jgi:hypothetical protein